MKKKERHVEKEMKEAVSAKVLNEEIDVNTGNMDEIVERVRIALMNQIQEIASWTIRKTVMNKSLHYAFSSIQ